VQADGTASGGSYISSQPNVGLNINAGIESDAPQVNYRTQFDQAGTYYVWVHGRGAGVDDSIHIGIDGVVAPFGNHVNSGLSGQPDDFVWTNTNAFSNPTRIDIPAAGTYDFTVFMREDGNDLDKIILTTDPTYTPVGIGQASTLTGSGSIFNVGFAVDEAAQNAEFIIDGTVISRANNSVDDVIEGLTFELLAATGVGEEIKVNVTADRELVQSAILNFVDAYNEFRIFAARQLETNEDGSAKETAVLNKSSSLRAILGRVNAEVATVVQGLAAGNFDRLADIGLNFSDFPGDNETPFTRNIITVDEAKLSSAISANFNQVRALFEFDFTTTDPNLTVFSRDNGLGVSNVTLNIDQTNGIFQATYTDPVQGLVTIALSASPLTGGNGVTLSAPANSRLSGLVLIYASGDDATVSLNLRQGVGDRMYNTLETALQKDNGLITTELDSLSRSSNRLREEIARIDDQVKRFREQLLRQFSALESAIAQSNLILQSLSAQADARMANR
jgi:flagellar hook-associated protein 2